MPELLCESVDVHFGGLVALANVGLRVPEGHVTGLIGPNGAGKTTLFNVFTGIQPIAAGAVRLDGEEISKLRPARRARLGLARTFQRLELFGSLSARENIQMAAETQRRKLPAGTNVVDETERLLGRVGLLSVADEPTDSLPTGLARLVEVARALATQPSVLLLDEPSSGLNHEETAELGRLLADLAGDGMGVLLVEHDMQLVMGVCDAVTVLDAGQVISSGSPDQVRADPLVQEAYLGSEPPHDDSEKVTYVAPLSSDNGVSTSMTNGLVSPGDRERVAADTLATHVERPVGPANENPPILIELEEVRAAYGRIEVVHGVSLTVARGSVTALLGPNGAGKSTLLKVVSGLMSPSAGRVTIEGKSILGVQAERLARQGVCAVPEGRAIFPNLTVAENFRMFTYRGKEVSLSEFEDQSFERFPILGNRRRQLAGRLSGGEQQMLALARALFSNPKVLVLDELSMGLAPLIVGQLYEVVMQLVRQEKVTVLLAEQFATTAIDVSDKALIMVMGEIVDQGEPAAMGELLGAAYLGATA